MNFNFELFLVIATAVTGLIWLLDNFLWRAKRQAQAGAEKKASDEIAEPVMVEYSKAFFPVLFLVLILRSFLMEPFRIPSGSMLPTLEVGDFILVNKYTYGIRLPVLRNKVIEIGAPQRGDVVVFKYPENPKLDYIKRIVGLPGDEIAYRNKQLYINGEAMAVSDAGPYHRVISRSQYGEIDVKHEVLGNVKHDILNYSFSLPRDYETIVPSGHYFVMGDNRDDSRDSREWGYMPERNLVGKAVMIWMHWDFSGDGLNFRRIGTKIQ